MKKLAVVVFAVWSLALCDRLVLAQTQVIPNGLGGYNVYGPQGTTQVIPNGVGGYNTYGPNGTTQIHSNGVGGYSVYGPEGTTQVIPNGVGGYNSYGPNVWFGLTQIKASRVFV